MSDANPERGEHELTLDGRTFKLRPSYAAIVQIEKKTGYSLLALVKRGSAADISAEQVGIIAAELIRAGATDDMTRRVNADRIAEMAFEEGLPPVIARLTLCLVDAATGGRTAAGEAKPVAETIEEPATGD